MAFNIEKIKEYAYPLVGAIYEVHSELGPGLNEYVYQEGVAMQLEEEGIPYEREKELTITYHGKRMNATYLALTLRNLGQMVNVLRWVPYVLRRERVVMIVSHLLLLP